MPFELQLPLSLKRARWKIKIQEKEIREPPHVSILRGTQKWRIDLRTAEFMDRTPRPVDVPKELLRVVEKNWDRICREWDKKYPANPVGSEE